MKKLRSSLRLGAIPLSMAALLVCSPQSARALTQTWGNTGTDFNTGASWLSGTAPVTSGTAIFNTAATTQPNLSSSLSLGTLTFSVAAASGYDLTSSSTSVVLTLTSVGTGANSALNSSGTFGSNTIDAPLIFGAASGSTQTITSSANSYLILNGSIGSTNSINLSLASTGTFRLNGVNTNSGTTTQLNGSTIIIGNSAAFGSSVLNIASTGKLLAAVDLTGANKLTNNVIWGGNATISNSSFGVEFGGTVNLNGAARTVNAADAAGTIFDGVISNDGGGGLIFTLTNGSLVTLKGANTYTGNTTIAGTGTVSVSNIGNSGAAGNLGQGTAINLGSTSSNGALLYTGTGETTSKAINLAGTTGGGTIDQSGSGLLKFTGFSATGAGSKTLTLQGSTAGSGEFNGNIVDSSSGSVAVTKAGTGTWTLSGSNTYTGATTVSSGLLVLTGTNAVLNTSAVNVNGGAVQLTNSNAAWNTAVVIGASGTLQFASGIGTVNLGNLGGAGNLVLADAGGTAVTLNVGSNNGVTSSAFSGSLIGTTAFNKVGTNTVTLSGSNTGYSQNINIKNGTLAGGGVASEFGTGTIMLGDSTGSFSATLAIGTVSGGIGNNIVVQAGNTGTTSLASIGSAQATYNGMITVNKDLYVTAAGTGGVTIGSSSTGEYLSGTGNLIYNGVSNSSSVVTGTNTSFTGAVIVNSGTLKLSSNTGISFASASSIAVDSLNNATLFVAGSQKINGLVNGANGGGTVLGNSSGTTSVNLAGSGAYVFSGSIANLATGTFSVLKTGSGTQTLSGPLTYTGATTVNAGTLLINGSSAGSAVAVSNANTVLGGSGTIAPGASHSLAVNNGAILAPGTDGTVGTLTVSLNSTGDAASFATGAKFSFDLAAPGTNDVLAFTGLTASSSDVTFNGNVINFTNIGGLAGGTYTLFTFDAASAYTGTLTIGTGLSGFVGSTLSYNANSIVLNVVPEPATAAMTGLGFMGALYLIRRRRR